MGRGQDTRDSGGNAITEEEYALLDKGCGFSNIQVNLRVPRFHGDKGKIYHTNSDVEIQGTDCRQAANTKVLKIENCFLASEVFSNRHLEE